MRPLWATVLILMGLQATSAAGESVSFADDMVGAAPKGWTLTLTGKGQPNWTVQSDAGGAKVLRQTGNATYPLALKDGSRIKDGHVEARFKAIAGKEDRAGGLVWRARDANNYYVVRANALEDNVVAYKTVDGKRSPLAIVGRKGGYGVKAAVPPGTWHTLRVEFAGTRSRIFYDGKHLFDVEDATFTEAGQVGLWTKADSVTEFDAFAYGAN